MKDCNYNIFPNVQFGEIRKARTCRYTYIFAKEKRRKTPIDKAKI